MLNMYQLWLDDLYPRAKFADALTILEKLGHTKRMQLIRKDWIREGRPHRTREDDEAAIEEFRPEPIFPEQDPSGIEVASHSAGEDESLRIRNAEEQENPDEDELDALLAESEQPNLPGLPLRNAPQDEDPFADEMDAMEGMDW